MFKLVNGENFLKKLIEPRKKIFPPKFVHDASVFGIKFTRTVFVIYPKWDTPKESWRTPSKKKKNFLLFLRC